MLAPECQPITFAFGLLEPGIDVVRAALQSWYGQQLVARRLVPATGDLPTLLRQLEPLSAGTFKRMWVTTESRRWRTACFDGSINGGDPFPPVSYLARLLGAQGVTVTSQPHSRKCPGAQRLELYGPEQTEWLNLIWSVSALHDGYRWEWNHFGEEQPFEETAAYTSRRVQDRFTAEMLRRYCRALEIPLESNAYGPEGMLDVPADLEAAARREGLAAARVRLGLE